MRYLLYVMFGGAILAGLVCIYLGVRGLFRMAFGGYRLLKGVGTVTGVERKLVVSPSRGWKGTRYSFIPTIRFTDEFGEAVEFRSEIGNLGRESSYRVGQTLDVLYDPLHGMPPMLDTWFARWGSHFVCMFSGMAFFGAAWLVYWVLGQPVFAAN